MASSRPAAPRGLAAGMPQADSLQALVTFARTAAGADLAVLFSADESHDAFPLAVDPVRQVSGFSLASSRIHEVDWSDGAVEASSLTLPSSMLTALGGPADKAFFIATPVETARRSGILLAWARGDAPRITPSPSELEIGLRLLTSVTGQLLRDRNAAMQRELMTERFHDLFESVSSGVVVLDNDGMDILVNQGAADLLGLGAANLDPYTLSAAMRDLRASCVNAAELAEAYRPLQSDIDYSVVATWDLGGRQFEVDTHPIRSNGQNGRIWLFHDVTARHLLERNLRRLAETDPLTGLCNRRSFEEASTIAFATAPSLAALMIDVDHFKSINDTYGHAAGDQVLQAIAARCVEALRSEDLIARLGGEEFVVMAAGLGVHDATAAADRLRRAICAAPVPTDVGEIETRVSVGVAVRERDDESFDAMLRRADAALYRAKREGRNRIVVAMAERADSPK